MKRSIGVILIIIVLSLFGIHACQKDNSPLPVLRIGHAPHDHHSALYIAALNPEYFKENGGIYLKEVQAFKAYLLASGQNDIARVVIDSSTGGKELIRKLSENYFDLSFGGVPAMLHFIDRDNAIRILTPIMSEGAALVVHKDSPIENWNQFKHHIHELQEPFKIGYKVEISVQNLIFERALDEVDISYSRDVNDPGAKVLLLNLYGAKNLIPALKNRLIDGFVVMQPYPAMAEHQKIGKVIASLSELPPTGRWEGHPCCALAANQEYTQKHPDITAAMLTLILRANRFINQYPERSAGQIAQWLQIPADVELKSIPSIKFVNNRTPQWRQGIDFWIESMIQQGVLKGEVKRAFESKSVNTLIYDEAMYERAKGNL